MTSHYQELSTYMAGFGLRLPDDPRFNVFVRIPGSGKSRGCDGYYKIIGSPMEYEVAHFGDHSSETKESWCPDITNDKKTLSKEEYDSAVRIRRESARHRDRERETGFKDAAQHLKDHLWAMPLAQDDHPYLQAKKVRLPAGGNGWCAVRLEDSRLLVPLTNPTDNDIWSYQSIDPAGNKRFAKGGKVAGMAHLIRDNVRYESLTKSEIKSQFFLLCEGFSTGLTLHDVTGFDVYCAMSASNLKVVANALKNKFGRLNVLICGDNDHEKEKNTGKLAVKDAYDMTGIEYIFPPDIKGCSDLNDLANHNGPRDIEELVNQAWRKIRNQK